MPEPTACARDRCAERLRTAFLQAAFVGVAGCGVNLAPAPSLTVVNVKDLGTIPTNDDVLGRDGGYSALFQGQSVWLYGDTFLAQPNAENFSLISDSWSYTSGLNAAHGISGFQQPIDSAGAPTMLLPETAAEAAFNAAHNRSNCQQHPAARDGRCGWRPWWSTRFPATP